MVTPEQPENEAAVRSPACRRQRHWSPTPLGPPCSVWPPSLHTEHCDGGPPVQTIRTLKVQPRLYLHWAIRWPGRAGAEGELVTVVWQPAVATAQNTLPV